MKLLIGVATFPTEPFVYEQTAASIKAAVDQLPEDVEWFIKYYHSTTSLDHLDDLVVKHNQMRADVFSGEYDALLTVEADIIIPEGGIAKLLDVDADVAYGLYVTRRTGIWLCFPEIDGFKAKSITATRTRAQKAWGTVVKTEGAGFGLTLIHRRVLEAIEFHHRERPIFADDWHFALDVKRAGFQSKHHLGVVCGHVDRDGAVLWPDLEQKKMYRRDSPDPKLIHSDLLESDEYRIVKPIWSERESRHLMPGETIVLSRESAVILLKRRFVAVMEKPNGTDN